MRKDCNKDGNWYDGNLEDLKGKFRGFKFVCPVLFICLWFYLFFALSLFHYWNCSPLLLRLDLQP